MVSIDGDRAVIFDASMTEVTVPLADLSPWVSATDPNICDRVLPFNFACGWQCQKIRMYLSTYKVTVKQYCGSWDHKFPVSTNKGVIPNKYGYRRDAIPGVSSRLAT